MFKPGRNKLLHNSERITGRRLLHPLFPHFLAGKPFLLRTDHSALTWLNKIRDPIGQNARWLEQLGEYTFEIRHRPGLRHSNAGALSRRPCPPHSPCSACRPKGEATVKCRAIRTPEAPNFLDEPPGENPEWWCRESSRRPNVGSGSCAPLGYRLSNWRASSIFDRGTYAFVQ